MILFLHGNFWLFLAVSVCSWLKIALNFLLVTRKKQTNFEQNPTLIVLVMKLNSVSKFCNCVIVCVPSFRKRCNVDDAFYLMISIHPLLNFICYTLSKQWTHRCELSIFCGSNSVKKNSRFQMFHFCCVGVLSYIWSC